MIRKPGKKPFSLFRWLDSNSSVPGLLFLRLPLVSDSESFTRSCSLSAGRGIGGGIGAAAVQ